MDILCDIDGTIADLSHRRHWIASKPKNYKAFFGSVSLDTPIKPVIETVKRLHRGGATIIFCSGRPERTRDDTITWLRTHIPCLVGQMEPHNFLSPLYMRKDHDFRADDIVKSELLDRIYADGHNPIIAFDDRQRVVNMWRARGIVCAQVAEGDF